MDNANERIAGMQVTERRSAKIVTSKSDHKATVLQTVGMKNTGLGTNSSYTRPRTKVRTQAATKRYKDGLIAAGEKQESLTMRLSSDKRLAFWSS